MIVRYSECDGLCRIGNTICTQREKEGSLEGFRRGGHSVRGHVQHHHRQGDLVLVHQHMRLGVKGYTASEIPVCYVMRARQLELLVESEKCVRGTQTRAHDGALN